MGSKSLQFHAPGAELLVELLPAWIGTQDAHVALEWFEEDERPFESQFGLTGVAERRPDRIYVQPDPFEALDARFSDFLAANPERLILLVAWETPRGLDEAKMDGGARWSFAFRAARRSLRRGGLIHINGRGERSHSPGHLYSDGALELARSGVHLIGMGGGTRYEIDPAQQVPRPPR